MKYLTIYWITNQLTGAITRVFSLDAAELLCERGGYSMIEQGNIETWELMVNWPAQYRAFSMGGV